MSALFKGGNTDDLNSYRPISMLPVLSKIIEPRVHNHQPEYLNDHDLIYRNQSGFRKMHSTETAIAYIVDTMLFNLDQNNINGMFLVDYKKAFDMVDRVTLLRKLEAHCNNLDKFALLWLKIIFNRWYSIGFIQGTVIVLLDYYSRCAAGFLFGSLAFCYVY